MLYAKRATTLWGIGLAAAGMLLGLAAPALAQSDYPSQPIRIVVPNAPGGSADYYARGIAKELERELGQPVVVENREGGNGLNGANYVAQAKPDGYTILSGHRTSLIAAPLARPDSARFKFPDDFEVVGLYQSHGTNTIFVHPSLGVSTFDEFVEHARKASAPIPFGDNGPGSSAYVIAKLIGEKYEIPFNHIAYNGAGARLTALLSGEVQATATQINLMSDHIAAGNAIPILVLGSERFAAYPDLPTIHDIGLDAPSYTAWNGLFLPKGAPEPIVARLQEALRKGVASEGFQEFVRSSFAKAAFVGGDEALARFQSDFEDRSRFNITE